MNSKKPLENKYNIDRKTLKKLNKIISSAYLLTLMKEIPNIIQILTFATFLLLLFNNTLMIVVITSIILTVYFFAISDDIESKIIQEVIHKIHMDSELHIEIIAKYVFKRIHKYNLVIPPIIGVLVAVIGTYLPDNI